MNFNHHAGHHFLLIAVEACQGVDTSAHCRITSCQSHAFTWLSTYNIPCKMMDKSKYLNPIP